MASRRKKSDQPAPQSVVPEYVQQARVYQRKKVTKRSLPTFQEAMLLLHTPEALRMWWEGVMAGMQRGEKWAFEMVGEINHYIKAKGFNLTLSQQMMNQNVAAGEQSPVVGYDALVRQIAEARAGHALPAPPEVIDIGVSPPGGLIEAPAAVETPHGDR